MDIIKKATPTIKHSQDTRETITENDLWGQYIETKSDGTIIVHDDWVTNPNASNRIAWNSSIASIEDNKAYTSSEFYANIQTEKIKDGKYMLYRCHNITAFTSDLPSLTDGLNMFYTCGNLTTFTSDLPSLTDGSQMFYDCRNLTTFTSDLSSLTTSRLMFYNCALTSFNSDLPSLIKGDYMFDSCYNLTTFTSNLPNLSTGDSMFIYCDLTSFNSDLPSLINGTCMFQYCTNLTSFTSDLSSLTDGEFMFSGCSLDAKSVMFIADTIKDVAAEKQLYQDGIIPYVTLANGKYSAPKGFMSNGNYVYTYNNPQPYTTTISASLIGKLTIGINVTNNSSTIADQLQTFAEEATFDSWEDLKQAFVDKGWDVTWQYGGTSTSITYDMRGERTIPCPIYAQLVEVEDKEQAEYTNEEGTKFYNITWGHDVTNYDDFQQFDSLEDAQSQMRLKKIGEEEIETA